MVNKKEILHNEFVQDLEDYKKMIFKLAHSYSNSYDGTLDLTQEIILQLWKSYTSYNSAFKKSTWIYRIALNVCISQLRKSTNRKKTEAAYTSLQQIFTLNNDIQLEQLNLLKKYIEELNSFDKALILLYLDGQKNDEIAQILGISETNTSTRISRIKDKLKNTHKQTIS